MIVSRPISSTRLIRTYNASTVLRVLYKHGSCSRSQLTKLTGMSPATITRIIAELMEQEIVLEGKVGKSTGGRRPVYVHIDYTKVYIGSVKLLQDDCAIAILDLRGQIIERERIVPHTLEPKILLQQVINSLNGLLEHCRINREHILGVGVAVSGVCDSDHGVVLNSVNLGWRDVPVTEILSGGLDLPVYLENDANASALAELWFGQATDATNSMFIKTETGAGVGIIVNKTLLTGPNFMAGEIGHVPLVPNGQPCRCGQRGCLEPYVYFGDIQTRYQEKTNMLIDQEEFIKLVHGGNQCALELVNETASALALACAHWGILTDMDIITIGGLWSQFNEEVMIYCQDYYNSVLESTGISRSIRIVGTKFGDDTDLLGAAGLVVSHWLTPQSVP